MLLEEADPKGLIRESYRIDGISLAECRSIFIDWALSLGPEIGTGDALERLIAEYAAAAGDHPMNAVLQGGLAAPLPPRRRGGRLGRGTET